MSNHTYHTAPTQFIEAEGVRLAYRRFGKKEGVPLIFIPHILGNMDSWDPSVTDEFANDREVILFNNAGIASSTGVLLAGRRSFAEAGEQTSRRWKDRGGSCKLWSV